MKAPELDAPIDELVVERVSTLDGLIAMRADWDRLQDAGEWKHVLLDHRWATAWWRHFGGEKELHVLVLRRGSELVGIAPFVLSKGLEAFPAKDAQFKIIDDYQHLRVPRWRRVVPVRRVTLLVNLASHNEHSHVLLDEEDPELYERILQYWRERSSSWDLFVMDGLPEDSPQPDGLRAAAGKVGLKTLAHGKSLGLFSVELGNSIEDFLKSRSRHFRKRHRAELRANESAGTIEFDEYRGGRIEEGLGVLFELESRSWKVDPTSTRDVWMPLDERIRGFFREVATSFAETDQANILVMKLDGVPVAGLYGLTRQRVRLTLVTYMDNSFRGRVSSASLFRAFLEGAIDDGMTRVDYNGCGLNAQKFANLKTNYKRLYFHHSGPYSRLLGGTKASATWLSKTVRAWRSNGAN